MHYVFNLLILAAKTSGAPATDAGGKGFSLPVGIILFFIVLGLAVTLSPPKRTYEVKRPKED